jgi:3'-phosphoadenosine 5'-phosphosulfate (PAPS) 3'-phosphatase
VIREIYDEASAATYKKGDGSPVTDADLAADRAIREVLGARFHDDPILSEEGQDDSRRLGTARCWIVDPLDGTEQFILRTGNFDVLVALVEDGRPVIAAGYQPTTRTLITAAAGGGAWMGVDDGPRTRLMLEPASEKPRLATSKWFGAPGNEPIIRAVAARLGVEPQPPTIVGLSPRMFLTPRAIDVLIGVRSGEDQSMASEWDFTVADLVYREAGGELTDLAGNHFTYNKPAPRNMGGLIAAADRETHALVLGAVRSLQQGAEGH